MTGCQEKNSGFFLKLPLKELQSLCKTHDLPTNKTRVKLAYSLASFFKKKNAYTSSLENRSSSPVKASYTVPLSESQRKEIAHPPEEERRAVVGAFEARTNSSECDSYKLMSGIKVAGADMPHCQAGIQPYNAAEGVVCPCTPHTRAGEGFCCATSEPVIGASRRLVTADVQGNTRNTEVGVGCHGAVTRNETRVPSPSKIVGQEMSDNVTADRGPKQVVAECSMGSKLLSSDEIKTKALPSFEFSVYAEEGINLHVDLNSNMSEYINDMIIRQKAQHQNSWPLLNHVRGLADAGKLETSDIKNNDSTLCQVPMEKGATESLGTSENHLPSRQIQHVCGDHGNSVAEESISAINADLGGCIAGKEIESSKCLESQSSTVRRLESQSSSVRRPKRSYHTEFPSKSQQANSKNKRTMSLRNAKTLERETFPRQSTQHIKSATVDDPPNMEKDEFMIEAASLNEMSPRVSSEEPRSQEELKSTDDYVSSGDAEGGLSGGASNKQFVSQMIAKSVAISTKGGYDFQRLLEVAAKVSAGDCTSHAELAHPRKVTEGKAKDAKALRAKVDVDDMRLDPRTVKNNELNAQMKDTEEEVVAMELQWEEKDNPEARVELDLSSTKSRENNCHRDDCMSWTLKKFKKHCKMMEVAESQRTSLITTQTSFQVVESLKNMDDKLMLPGASIQRRRLDSKKIDVSGERILRTKKSKVDDVPMVQAAFGPFVVLNSRNFIATSFSLTFEIEDDRVPGGKFRFFPQAPAQGASEFVQNT